MQPTVIEYLSFALMNTCLCHCFEPRKVTKTLNTEKNILAQELYFLQVEANPNNTINSSQTVSQ